MRVGSVREERTNVGFDSLHRDARRAAIDRSIDRHDLLDVAQQESTWMTPTRSLVQSQPFRRMGVAQWKSSRMPVTHLPSPARRADRGMVLVNLQVAWFDSGHPFAPMPPFKGRDTTLRRLMDEVRFLSVARNPVSYVPRRSAGLALFLHRRLGRLWSPNPGSSVRFAGGVQRNKSVWQQSRWVRSQLYGTAHFSANIWV